jgi:hypothetical protein
MKAQCEICTAEIEGSALCIGCIEAISRLVSISSRFRVDYDNETMAYKLTAAPPEERTRQNNLAGSAMPQPRVVRRIVNFRL